MGTSAVAEPPGLLGQTVVILGGGTGVGLATARAAKRAGARPEQAQIIQPGSAERYAGDGGW